MAVLNHIEIMREDTVRQYRFPSFPNAPRPTNRDRATHGKKLGEELSQTTEFIESKRVHLGIDSENLLVLEVISDAMSREILENMLVKFNLFLVEETDVIDPANPNKSKLVIQFEDKAALNLFNQERELWQNDDPNDAILTYAQRRDLFNCIENIRSVSREDRIGSRLKKYFDDPSLFPEGFFVVNIDVWYNGDRSKIIETERIIKKALGTQGSTLLGDLFEIPSLLLGRAQVNEFTLNALLDLDVISLVDLPLGTVTAEQYELYSLDFDPIIHDNLGENAPLAAVLDSGVFSANPLLSNVIVGEEEFDNTENTTSDLHGHGTGVAGIVVYGDFNKCIETKVFTPLVRICNGKIMHNENGDTCFPADKIKKLFEVYLSGLSLSEAAQKAGIKRYHTSIARMLADKRYVEDKFYPPIISKDTFEKAQLERRRRAEALGRIYEHKGNEKKCLNFRFHASMPDNLYDDPFQQAEYAYSLIKSEVILDDNQECYGNSCP
jgi:hypothetical protein